MKVIDLLKATRPIEYVSFFNFRVPTLEGPVFAFMACDTFSEFAFSMGFERDESDATVIKAVFELLENKEFLKHRHNGFTLVFARWEHLSTPIEALVGAFGGKVLFDKNFHKKISAPVVESFTEMLRKKSMR